MKRFLTFIFSAVLPIIVFGSSDVHVLDMRHGLSESRIRKICQMPDGRIAVATTSTIDVFDGTRFLSYRLNPSFAYPLDLYQGKRQLTCDTAGRVWLRNKGQLFVVDTRRGELVKDVAMLIQELGLTEREIAGWRQVHSSHTYGSHNDISSVVQDSYGGLWLGTLENGILYENERRDRQFDTKDSVFRYQSAPRFSSSRTATLVKRFSPDISNCTLESDDGYAWIGTLNGLMVYDENNNPVATIDSHYGLGSDNVLSIVSDKDKNIWIATSNGISRISKLGKERFKITNYGELDGIILNGREFRPLQIDCDSIGKIVVGFGGGTVSFLTDSVNAPRYSFYYPDPYIQRQIEADSSEGRKSPLLSIVLIVSLIALSVVILFLLLIKRNTWDKVMNHNLAKDTVVYGMSDGVSDATIRRLKSESESERTNEDEEFIVKIRAIIEEHIDDEDFSVQTLSDCMAMDRTGLYRRLQSLTGKSPSVYIREIRLEVAARLLRESDMPVSDIAFMTGYSSTKYFNKVFKQSFSVSPEEYRKNQPSID